MLKEPKLILPRLETIFYVCCLLLAIYWITLFTAQYGENKDLVFISVKKFNDEPSNKYPTFSICFEGDKFHWYHVENIFSSYSLNSSQYELMLKGEEAMRDELNTTSKAYYQIPVEFKDGITDDMTHFHLTPIDFLYELKYSTESTKEDSYFFNEQHGNATSSPFLALSYQSADKICFTRNPNDNLKSIRYHDLVTFNRSIIGNKMYGETLIQVFIHYPGQLIRSFDEPKYESSLQYFLDSTINTNPLQRFNILEFKIKQVKSMQKRSDSNNPCNDDILDYDQYYQEQIVKELSCIPPYWNGAFNDSEKLEYCTSTTKLQEAFHLIKSKTLMEFPCTEMIVLNIDSINDKPQPKPKDVSMAFFYNDKTFEEIKYTKSMEFVGWLSNVGGFIGIFLGYSMMQIPELLSMVMKFLSNQRKKFCNGT